MLAQMLVPTVQGRVLHIFDISHSTHPYKGECARARDDANGNAQSPTRRTRMRERGVIGEYVEECVGTCHVCVCMCVCVCVCVCIYVCACVSACVCVYV